MPIVRTGESEYDKELAKWNTPKRQGGYGPDGYEEYPKMLYKAFLDANGKAKCMEPPPLVHMYLTMPEFLRAEAIATAFTQKCQMTVRSAHEEDKAKADGWRRTPGEALAHFEALQQEIAQAAAEAQFAAKRMSDKARAEFAEADASTSDHVVDVIAAAKAAAARGRKARGVTATETEA
jgi:hypothetical protein